MLTAFVDNPSFFTVMLILVKVFFSLFQFSCEKFPDKCLAGLKLILQTTLALNLHQPSCLYFLSVVIGVCHHMRMESGIVLVVSTAVVLDWTNNTFYRRHSLLSEIWRIFISFSISYEYT